MLLPLGQDFFVLRIGGIFAEGVPIRLLPDGRRFQWRKLGGDGVSGESLCGLYRLLDFCKRLI
jgi:hypothetical protein